MPVTRAQLQQDYQENHVRVKTQIVTKMFDDICRQITTANHCGNTSYTMNLMYSMYWEDNAAMIESLATMFREYYIDSEVTVVEKKIKVDWSLPRPPPPPQPQVRVDTPSEQNIQINITLPSRVMTRAAAKAATKTPQ